MSRATGGIPLCVKWDIKLAVDQGTTNEFSVAFPMCLAFSSRMVDCKGSRSASPVHRRRAASSTHCWVTALGLSCTVLSEDPFLWTQLVGLSDEKILRVFLVLMLLAKLQMSLFMCTVVVKFTELFASLSSKQLCCPVCHVQLKFVESRFFSATLMWCVCMPSSVHSFSMCVS